MRQPSIGRLIALMIGATVVLLLTIDTAMACRFFLRRPSHIACSPVMTCPPVIACPLPCSTENEVVVHYDACSSICGEPIYDNSCVSGCEGGEVVVGTEIVGTEYEPDANIVQPAQPTPAIVPEVKADDSLSEVPAADDADIAPRSLPDEFNALPDDTDLVEPAIVEEPVDEQPEEPNTFFAEPAAEQPLDAADEATDSAPPDDFFSEPADDAPAADMPADDLDVFEQPAGDLPSDDDLFGTPAEDAGDAVDDAFGQPAPLEEDADLPGFEEPAAEEPSAEDQPADEPADSLDDLFGATQNTTDTEPRTAARGNAAAATDLFDAVDQPADAATPAAGDDLFQDPVAAPVEDKKDDDAAKDLDDLFGARPAKPMSTQTVATKTEELPFRQWTDNTGQYKTLARLANVTETHVRLLKDNGRYSTVSKRRLSQDDLKYVEQTTEQFGRDNFDQVARR